MKRIIIALYALFLFVFSAFSCVFVDPNLSFLKNIYSGFAFHNRSETTVLYALLIIVFFAFYASFVWLGVKKKLNKNNIYLLLGVTGGILLFSYPAMLSYDIFNYIATSKIAFFYHENPYVIMPIEFIGDPLLAFTHAANKIALYGPFWVLLTGIPFLIGIGNFIFTLFAFKFIALFFYIATVFLIWKISKNLLSIIIFAFNPLVIIETLLSGHNDVVMMFFALAAIFLTTKKKYVFACFLLLLSILIKYATLFLIPIFIYLIYAIAREKNVNWEKIYLSFTVSMTIIFLLSPIREEIYPWYAMWFLTISSLVKNKFVFVATSTLSFGLLLRYVPYMYLGTYNFPTPLLKIIFMVIPVMVGIFYYWFKIRKI
jgi:hypothetical protein